MRLVALPLVLAALTAPAFAQSNELTDQAAPQATYKPVTIVEFDNRDVTATADKPGIILSTERPREEFKPLIVLRASFNPEMEQSAAEVR